MDAADSADSDDVEAEDPVFDDGTANDVSPGDARDSDTGPDPIAVSGLSAIQNPANGLSYFVRWSTDRAVPTTLRVDCGVEYQQTFAGDSVHTEHEVFVMGLFVGLICEVTPHPEQETSGQISAQLEDLSIPAELPELEVEVLDLDRMQPGWTLWSVARATTAAQRVVVAVDPQGRYRWYYAPGASASAAGNEVQVINGAIWLGSADPQQIVTWEGNVTWELDRNSHHDLRPSPFTEGHILHLSATEAGCDFAEHTVEEVNMETGDVIWTWSVCEHWTPREPPYQGWSHLNTVEPVLGERAMLVSSRNQDMIFKVDRDSGDLVWALGLNGDFDLGPGDHFLRQHAPEIQPDGTILLFDNGLSAEEAAKDEMASELARPYSRAVQYELFFDELGEPDGAEIVWEYVDESLFAENRSEADRLANGNTLLHYVWVHPDIIVRLREVTDEGDVVWDVATPPDYSSYRSERIGPHYGNVLTP